MDKYDTKLTEADEKKFQKWAADEGRQNDTIDYDLRGWWKENQGKDTKGHLTDKHKKPNSPTFSSESKYSGKNGNVGGKWKGNEKEGYSFEPSAHNLKNMDAQALQKYFDEVEPGVKLFSLKPLHPILHDNPRSPK